MSYLVLARKSRPARFSEVVGQKAVVRTLQNALAQQRVAHAMIFSGVRGVGKTTLARIMAKAINCEQGTPESEPCNACRSCKEISSGSSVDLIEIDGASNRGIQEIRELKENIRFMPSGSKFKIIIIDEVHMLTTEAFNALLKTLEEPPDHVYFMFATTELHRVPVTILSRCQRYELKRIPSAELGEHFKQVAAGENIEIDQAALNIIVREAAGSVRDGLSLLDQVFSYCGSTVSGSDVTEMLGLVSNEAISEISTALLHGNIDEALGQLDKMYEYGLDMKRFINDLLSWFRALVICKVSKQPDELLELPADQIAQLKNTASAYPLQTLTLMFNTLLENLEKAGFSSQPRFAVEMAFIKTVHARKIVPVNSLLGRLDELLEGNIQESDKKKTDNEPQIEKPPPPSEEPQQQKPESTPSEPLVQSLETEKNDDESTPQEPAELQEKGKSIQPDDVVDVVEDEEVMEEDRIEEENELLVDKTSLKKSVRLHWPEFIDYVRDRKPWMASALQVASAVNLEGDHLYIHYSDPAECGLLKNRENVRPLTEFALDFFQENFSIHFVLPDAKECEIDPVNGKTPQQERKALANDALILTAVDVFNGEIGDIRVGPRFRKPIEGEEKP